MRWSRRTRFGNASARLPAGTRLYHGTKSRSKFVRLRGPMWLATHRGRAGEFGGRVIALETTRPLHLYVMIDHDRFARDFPDYAVLVEQQPHVGARVRQLALVARHGFDGWWMYKGDVVEEIMLLAPASALRLVPR